jgi:hypothetical protein
MDSVKLPKFTCERRDVDVWKKRFRAFGMMQEWALALSSNCAASSQQQVDMYFTLILSLPEEDLSIIENVSEDEKTCGHSAWTALVNHYEDDGVCRCTKSLQDLEAPQADSESGIQYLNRLVRLKRQLARVGNVVHDRRIIFYLVKGLRNEYHSTTDTWDVHNLSMDAVKRDLRQKGMRIENRAQSHTTEPLTPTAFAASHDDATIDLLKRQVSELQDYLKSLQGAATTRPASHGRGAARVFSWCLLWLW